MPLPVRKGEISEKVGEMLKDAHVLEPKTGFAAKKAERIGGSKYDVHPENVTPDLAKKITTMVSGLAGTSSSFSGLQEAKKHLGLDNPTIGLTVEDIRNVAGVVGKEISGDGKFQQVLKTVDERVTAATTGRLEAATARVQEDIKKGGGVNTHAAAQREDQGLAQNTPLVKTRAETMTAEQEQPSHGLPRFNGAQSQGKGNGGRGV